MTNNCICGQPTPDSWLCRTHDAELEQLVTELPALVGYLNDTIGRQVRFSSGRIGGRPAETPVAINEAASEVGKALRSELVRIVRHLIEARGVSPIRMPSDSLLSIATWVGSHVESIRQDETAGQTLTSLRGITRRVLRVIDRPKELNYLGFCRIPGQSTAECPCVCHTSSSVHTRPCDVIGGCHTHHQTEECNQPLYVEPGLRFVRCPACGYQHEVAKRQEALRDVARDTLMTLRELKSALPEVLGVPINHNTLRSWKHRKRIVAHSVTWDAQELFRVGDILDLAIEQQRGEAS